MKRWLRHQGIWLNSFTTQLLKVKKVPATLAVAGTFP
nr:MAG TPA: hypothetical protein [Caudoviricetes sp.]